MKNQIDTTGWHLPTLLIGFAIWGLYLIGLADPVDWWGVHFLAFVPPSWRWLILLASATAIIWAASPRANKPTDQASNEPPSWLTPTTIWIVALGMGILFYNFPFANDIYGDAIILSQSLDSGLEKMPEHWKEGLYNLAFTPSAGRRTMIALMGWIVLWTGSTFGGVLLGFSVLFGILFVVLWLHLVRTFISHPTWLLVLAVIGLSAPFMQIFYGHMEFYAITYTLQLAWLSSLLLHLKHRRASYYYLLFPLWLLCMKVHPTSLLLLPALLLVTCHRYGDRLPTIKKLLNWRAVLSFLLVPILLAGAYLYFIVFESQTDTRKLEGTEDLDHIFLPLFSPEPPLDRYNLLSVNHIFDFFNVILLWTPPGLFLLALLFVGFRRRPSLQPLPVLIIGFTLILYSIFLFVVNPLLSMPMDWDLFCLPAVLLLLLLMLLIQQTNARLPAPRQTLVATLGLALLSLPIFAINHSMPATSQRLEALGIRIFKTYYDWSETTLLTAVGMMHREQVTSDYIERKLKITDRLKDYAIPANDTIYAILLLDNGLYYQQVEQDHEKARAQFLEALSYQPQDANLKLKLLESCFRLGRYEESFGYAQQLVEREYPNRQKALRMAIHAALEAHHPTEAGNYCQQYLTHWPDDPTIRAVSGELEIGAPPESILRHFRRD